MKLTLWGTRPLYVKEEIAKSYREVHGEDISEKEAEALLLTEGIDKNSCMSNEHVRKHLEKLMKEDVAVNRQLATVSLHKTAREVMARG